MKRYEKTVSVFAEQFDGKTGVCGLSVIGRGAKGMLLPGVAPELDLRDEYGYRLKKGGYVICTEAGGAVSGMSQDRFEREYAEIVPLKGKKK